MSGTDLAHAPTVFSYAMSGTDLAHAPTPRLAAAPPPPAADSKRAWGAGGRGEASRGVASG
eukprot:2985655-Rhodomonas_salina.1